MSIYYMKLIRVSANAENIEKMVYQKLLRAPEATVVNMSICYVRLIRVSILALGSCHLIQCGLAMFTPLY